MTSPTKLIKNYVYGDFLKALEKYRDFFDDGNVISEDIDAALDMFKYLKAYVSAARVRSTQNMSRNDSFLFYLEETRRALKDFRNICLDEGADINKKRWSIFDELDRPHNLFSEMKNYYKKK